MATNPAAKAPKQLKKSDFLAVVTIEPMTRQDLVEALDDYSFLPSWLDYLVDHFSTLNKIQVNEDSTIQRLAKAGATSGPRMAYRVVYDDDNIPYLESKELATGEALAKDESWATTENRAVKNAVSAIHKQYQEDVTAVKDLLASDEEETSESEAA